MTLWPRLFKKKEANSSAVEVDRDCTLRVLTSDASCFLIVLDRSGKELAEIRSLSDGPAADPATLVSNAMLRLPAELQNRIGDVHILLDDPEISIVDSRHAKLTHFEGRTLSEFGKYQLGGRPSAFASSPYGQTSQTESEKRIVGYLSEDKLSAVLFSLGRLARYATFFGPWSLQEAIANSSDTVATLSLHGRFSTLTLANEAAGTVAVRHIPLGTASLIEAYGDAYGLSFQDAAQAMKSKPRLILEDGVGPAVASRQSLLPVVERLASEFNDTADYFEFQRLSGRAPALVLSNCGHEIAGITDWLSRLLQVDVHGRAFGGVERGLNFLEGMRSGLLKLGNQLFDFAGGRFVPSKLSPEVPKGRRGLQTGGVNSLTASLKALSSQPVTADTLRPLAPYALAAIIPAAILYGAYAYLVAPSGQRLEMSASAYQSTLIQAAPTPPQAAAVEPDLWARDLLALTALMAYDMRLTELTLTTAAPGAMGELKISGTLPQDQADSVAVVGRFLKRVSGHRILARRLSDIAFQGVESTGENAALRFGMTAKVSGGAAP